MKEKVGMSSDQRNKALVTSTDEESFEPVFTRYYPLVYQLAYRCTGRRDEADDIAQEVFLRFYRTPPQATSDAERRAWLLRLAPNLRLDSVPVPQRRISFRGETRNGGMGPASPLAGHALPVH